MTAIIAASFSWPNVPSSHWTGPAFWYASLSLCISAIFLASQQLSLLSLISNKDPAEEKDDKPEWERESALITIRRHLRQILKEKIEVTPRIKDDDGELPAGEKSSTVVTAVGVGAGSGRGRSKPADIEAQHGAGDMTQMHGHAKEVAVEGTETITEVPPSASIDALTKVVGHHSTWETIKSARWTFTRWTFSWKVIFVWQCPIMLIAYSTVFYMVGLFVFVCTPVLEVRKWGPESYVAVVYMASLGVSVWLFGFCSYGTMITSMTTMGQGEIS